MLRCQKGFNLVELMLIVGIIGTLASIGVPVIRDLRHRGRQAEAKVHLTQLYSSMKMFNGQWLQYYGDFRNIGFDVRGDNISYRTGFANGAGVASPTAPANYVGLGLAAGLMSTQHSTRHSLGYCGPTADCQEDPNAAIVLPNVHLWTATTFSAAACGQILIGVGDVLNNRECFSIDETKVLNHAIF